MKILRLLLMLSVFGAMASGNAAETEVRGKVIRTVVADGERWGGCVIMLDRTLANYGLDCPGAWVHFSCNGEYVAKDIAHRMFDSAQMAFALGLPVSVHVDDTKKLNGLCYGNRIDVLPAP